MAALLDERLVLAVAVVLFAGAVKSITGLGIPVVGTPLLVVIYDRLALMVVLMSLPTTLCSAYFVVRNLRNVREATRALLPLMPFGVLGVVVGSHVLVSVDQRLLTGLLAAVITAFVVTETSRAFARWRRRPAMSPVGAEPGAGLGPDTEAPPVPSRPSLLARSVVGSVVGFSAGGMQGASGASGPLVTMYLFTQPLSRPGFFLAVNAVFVVFDAVQFATLAGLGQFTQERLAVSVLATVPLFAGVALGARLARRISDAGFRAGVLLVLTAAALSLAFQAAG